MSDLASREAAVVPRRPSAIGSVLFAAVCVALLAGEIFVVFVRETGVPIVDRGPGARLLGEVAGETAVTQTFRLEAGGFSGISVEAAPYGGAVGGSAILTLSELNDTGTGLPVVQRLVPAADLVAASSYRMAFPPIEASKGKRYEFRVAAPDVPAGQGLGLWVTRDQQYLGGAATLGGREQWGDLVFRAHATRSTVFQRLEQLLSDKPLIIRSRVTLAAVLVLYNWSLAMFAWYLLFADDDVPLPA